MAENPNSLFRKQAIEHLTQLEQLHDSIHIVPLKSWIILSSLCFLVTALVIWGIWGSIPTWVDGQGILLAESGSVYNAVSLQGAGRVLQISVQPGDTVTKGQVVATLDQPDLSQQIAIAEKYLQTMQDQRTQLAASATQEIAAYHARNLEENQSLTNVIANATVTANSLGELLKIRQDALKKGLEPKQNVVSTEVELQSARNEIENSKGRIAQNAKSESAFMDQWHERLRDIDTRINDKQKELANLQAQYNVTHTIKSPIDGIVTTRLVSVGDHVENGTPIVSISNTNSGMDAIIYISPLKGKLVTRGMNALVSPTIIEKNEYGNIRGIVTSVSEYPSTPASMMAVFKNEELVKQFSHDESPIAVRVHLLPDAHTYSGLAWTSSQGPPQKITPGTIAVAKIIVRKQAPVSLIIPALKKLLGDY